MALYNNGTNTCSSVKVACKNQCLAVACCISMTSHYTAGASFGNQSTLLPGEKQTHSKLHTVATQMKQMMDAPEQVWSALEQQQYCDAAVVYLMVEAT